MAETFIKMSDELAAFIDAAPGTAVSDQHGSFVGAKHAYVIVEGGVVKLVVYPPGGAVPDEFKASSFHEPVAAPKKAAAAMNDLLTAAVKYAKAIGG